MFEKYAGYIALFLMSIILIYIYLIYKSRVNRLKYDMSIFNDELALINDEILVKFLRFYLQKVPTEFWTMPASTSGKYHPSYALGKGGLVRHTKAAVEIANSLLNLEMYNKLNKNLIIASLIVHDSVKPGFTKDGKALETQSEHPIFAVNLLEGALNEFVKSITNKESAQLSEQVEQIKRMVKSHMGQWNTDKSGKEILPKPEKEDEKFVHLCDYLASRKFLSVTDLEV